MSTYTLGKVGSIGTVPVFYEKGPDGWQYDWQNAGNDKHTYNVGNAVYDVVEFLKSVHYYPGPYDLRQVAAVCENALVPVVEAIFSSEDSQARAIGLRILEVQHLLGQSAKATDRPNENLRRIRSLRVCWLSLDWAVRSLDNMVKLEESSNIEKAT
jgi:hypothetical protein